MYQNVQILKVRKIDDEFEHKNEMKSMRKDRTETANY